MEQCKTIQEVAEKIGKTVDAIRQYRAQHGYHPLPDLRFKVGRERAASLDNRPAPVKEENKDYKTIKIRGITLPAV